MKSIVKGTNPMKKSRVTQYDIADSLNISQATVARVINDSPLVTDETRKRVLDKIAEMNYVPNIQARNLAKRSNAKIRISIVIPAFPEYFWGRVCDGLLAGIGEVEDVGLVYELVRIEPHQTEKLLFYLDDLLKNGSCDYLILMPVNEPDVAEKLNHLKNRGMGIIFINDDIKEVDSLFYVGPDNERSGRMAGELMGKFLRGTGNVIVVATAERQTEIADRIKGFAEVLKSDFQGIRVRSFFYDRSKEDSYTFSKNLLAQQTLIDGVYSADGYIREVGQAIDHSEKKGLVFVGHEYYSRMDELIDKKVISASINQDPYQQGFYCIKILYDRVLKKIPYENNHFYIDFKIIMKYTRNS
jgi:LacI family transcriptional regulator